MFPIGDSHGAALRLVGYRLSLLSPISGSPEITSQSFRELCDVLARYRDLAAALAAFALPLPGSGVAITPCLST